MAISPSPSAICEIERLFEGRSFNWVLESATDAMLIADRDGRIFFSNGAIERMFGYGSGEMLGLLVEDLIPERFREMHRSQRDQYAEQPRSRPMGAGLALVAARKDGGEFPVEISLSPLQTDANILTLATIHDITRRKLAEQRLAEQTASLRDSEARLRAVLDTAMNGVILLDAQCLIDSFNPRAERMFGYSEAEIRGRPLWSLTPSPYREEHEAIHASYLKSGKKESVGQTREIMGLRKDGSSFPMELGLSEMWLGGSRWFAAIARDVTERREAERRQADLLRELEIKNAELERFVYTVSHDLKSPLITIQGFAGVLEQSAARADTAHMRKDIGRIRAAADRMHSLLDDLLELSRIGRLANAAVETPLGDVAREAVDLLAGQAASREVEIDIRPGLPTVLADRQRLIEVFQNLVDNAIKFAGEQVAPRIEIGARENAGETVCYVRDNGIGIDPRYHDRVFGLFERLDQTTEGTGIGLAIVKRIIEVHGGRIWIESEGRGRGSAFCFSLPTASSPK